MHLIFLKKVVRPVFLTTKHYFSKQVIFCEMCTYVFAFMENRVSKQWSFEKADALLMQFLIMGFTINIYVINPAWHNIFHQSDNCFTRKKLLTDAERAYISKF